jgi:hypothetical protein
LPKIVRLSEVDAQVLIGAPFSRSFGIAQGDRKVNLKLKVLKKREVLALIEVEILLRRGSPEKIETDSRN